MVALYSLLDANTSSTMLLSDSEKSSRTSTLVDFSLSDDDKTKRGLQSHHIQLLAISGVIGTGLFVGTGNTLSQAGPGGILTGYIIWCIFLLCVAHAMGEMSSYLPVPGSFSAHCARFIDPAAGVAMGWMYAYSIMFTAADCAALSSLWAYWFPDINPGVWIAISLSVVVLLNLMSVGYFGEIEFYASILKIILIIAFLLFAFIVVLGGNPQNDRIGFRYWVDPGAFRASYVPGALGKFLSIWSTYTTAAFSIGGPDFIANCAPETQNPRKNIPKAVRRVIYRLIFFFILSVLAVGMLVPYNDEYMLSQLDGGEGVASSPFVVAMKRLNIRVLPDVVNAIVITSAWSCTNCLLYQASRTIYGLARNGQAPSILAKTTKRGLPLPALILTCVVSCIAFLCVNNNTAKVFNWFVNLGSISIMVAYFHILLANIRFRAGCKSQGLSIKSLPFRNRAAPFSNYFAITGVSIILITNGFHVFIKGHWSFPDFFTSYFGLLFYGAIFLYWKVTRKTKFIKAFEMDLVTGLAEVEDHEKELEDMKQQPKSRYQAFMDWLF